MRAGWRGVVAVWVAAVLGGASVLVFSEPAHMFAWFAVVLGCLTLFAFGIQLGGPMRKGIVERLYWAVGGSVVILAIFTASVAWLAVPAALADL
ncbi:hypothetical protein [Humidisolicoccus flavus]|uniref:hypothetical protein n=1 Tax=Humidisolicoccus flavus TaxID=3111414 RepID=UPI0032521AF4